MGLRKLSWAALDEAHRLAAWARMPASERLRALRSLPRNERQAFWNALTSDDRLALQRHVAQAPEQCGPAIIAAPARAGLVPFMPKTIITTATGDEREVETGYRGRHAARVRDGFDRMLALQNRKDRERNGPWFTPAQIEIGRDYAALTERLASSGVRGISLEVMAQRGATGDGGFIDAVIDDSRRLRAMQLRIGDGVAMAVRRQRPAVRGSRIGIKDRFLVDKVCLAGWTITEVLTSCGWKKDGRVINSLRVALANALDRMQGYSTNDP